MAVTYTDRETIARSDDHRALRIWLRLLTCTQMIERVVRSRLREQFGTTLPRFDLMAQLERHPEGLKMNELSRLLMVTGGNITAIVDQLEKEGLVERLEHFRALAHAPAVRAIVLRGEGGNFSSGGDVHEIIGPLTKMKMPQLLEFTRMTGDVVKAMRHCPQPLIAAVDGVCAGAGAILAMACDLRYAAPGAKAAFLFVRVGLAGCDMGACAMLPRIIGQGRAAELLYTGRAMSAQEGLAWGFFNEVGDLSKAMEVAKELAAGPTAAHAMTKKMLHQEWN